MHQLISMHSQPLAAKCGKWEMNDLMESIDLDRKTKTTVKQRHETVIKMKADDLQRLLPEDLK